MFCPCVSDVYKDVFFCKVDDEKGERFEEFQLKLRFFKEFSYLDEIKDSQSPDVNDTSRRLRAPKKIDEAADDFLLKYLKNEIHT